MGYEILSSCCGASDYSDGDSSLSDIGICSECRDHCEYIEFEDEDGEPVPQYISPDGFLTDQMPKYRPSLNTIATTVLGHICLFMLGAFMAVSMLFSEDEIWANVATFWSGLVG